MKAMKGDGKLANQWMNTIFGKISINRSSMSELSQIGWYRDYY